MPETQQYEFSVALGNASEGHQQLQLLAAGLGVNWLKLFRCLVKAIGLKAVIAALVSGDFWAALESIDWEAILACIGGDST